MGNVFGHNLWAINGKDMGDRSGVREILQLCARIWTQTCLGCDNYYDFGFYETVCQFGIIYGTSYIEMRTSCRSTAWAIITHF